MKKAEKEVEQLLLDKEKAMLKELQDMYIKALADVKTRIRLLQTREETQSVIYQLNYQRALESQINSILDLLEQDNITSVTDFMNSMYETGYIGTQYTLAKQGIPVITPINQQEVTSILYKKIEDMTFADRIGKHMDLFKRQVKEAVTRGIASASTYQQIANEISFFTGEKIFDAYRIARTEGHRVANEAKLISANKAKEQGADLVKQWDATLDSRTRPVHRELDGQVQELDQPFQTSIGRNPQRPGGFGLANQDINCRCIMLTRPRWAISDYRTKSAWIKNEYGEEVEKLISVKNYEDYKNGYYKLLEDDPKIVETVRQANERIKEYEAAGGYKNWLKQNKEVEQ